MVTAHHPLLHARTSRDPIPVVNHTQVPAQSGEESARKQCSSSGPIIAFHSSAIRDRGEEATLSCSLSQCARTHIASRNNEEIDLGYEECLLARSAPLPCSGVHIRKFYSRQKASFLTEKFRKRNTEASCSIVLAFVSFKLTLRINFLNEVVEDE